MDEPPKLPNDKRVDQSGSSGDAEATGEEAVSEHPSASDPVWSSEPLNPYAPSADIPAATANTSRIHLPVEYWMLALGALVAFVALLFFVPGLGVIGLFGLLAASIRVPLLQRRLSMANPDKALPNPSLLLFVSWIFMLVAGMAAMIAFMIVCIPAGIAVFSVANQEGFAITVVFGVSGLIGLGAFILLFWLSLRLPV